ncbi:ImmA/IrrE family metallo-endopeptidase [Schaalia turicensis]|uniref:ImmA/IrrE family metallo-endopeptidase n=1 Tax=Schaalia turicensis TaxID=131111 RepID=UPI0036A79CC1
MRQDWSSQGAKRAAQFREEHCLGIDPIEDVLSLPRMLGIDVISVDDSKDEHGYTAQSPVSEDYVFVVNSSLPFVRFRSTIAHEIAHFLFREEDLDFGVYEHEYAKGPETRAHTFARFLLLPLQAVDYAAQAMPSIKTEQLLNALVRDYGVSPRVASYQMAYAGIIDSADKEEFAKQTTRALANKYGWRDLFESRESSVPRELQPIFLQKQARDAYACGRITVDEFRRLIGADKEEEIPLQSFPQSLTGTNLDLSDDDLSDLL